MTNVTDIAVFNTTAIARVGEGVNAKFYAVGKADKNLVTPNATGTPPDKISEWQEIDLSAFPIEGEDTTPEPTTETVLAPTNVRAEGTTDNYTKIFWDAPTTDNVDSFEFAVCMERDGHTCVDDAAYGFAPGQWLSLIHI